MLCSTLLCIEVDDDWLRYLFFEYDNILVYLWCDVIDLLSIFEQASSPIWLEQNRTEQNRTKQNRTEQNRACSMLDARCSKINSDHDRCHCLSTKPPPLPIIMVRGVHSFIHSFIHSFQQTNEDTIMEHHRVPRKSLYFACMMVASSQSTLGIME